MTNTVLLVGNLGADPESRSTRNGTSVATLSLGTSRPKRDSEGKTFKDASGYTAKETEWHRVTCFNGLGKTVGQFATKGMLVAVRGRIHYSQYEKEGVILFSPSARYGRASQCPLRYRHDEVGALGIPLCSAFWFDHQLVLKGMIAGGARWNLHDC